MIPVFYTPKMVADSGCPSPSAAKPIKVVESWSRQFPIAIIEPTPVTIEDYARAHDRAWVESVLAGQADNGFDNRSPAVAASLPYTSGAMLSAARHALKTGGAAAAPCSGFHHAEYAKAMGYCTFNGLMVATLTLRAEGVSRIGILDLDMHYGNGTDHIIQTWDLDASSFSDHESPAIRHFTAGSDHRTAVHAAPFFNRWLPEALRKLADCNVVLYQAGADPHIDDPHGGWLTTPQLRQRDSIVFEALKAAGVPVAWNLAGGYQVEPDGSIPKVLEIHDNTMLECVRVFGA
jgi:acetoin utilization deacetylase AcuC-like enzyme